MTKKKNKQPRHLWSVFLCDVPVGVVCCRDGKQCVGKLVKAMGFKTRREYMNSLPGRCVINSVMMEKLIPLYIRTHSKTHTYFKTPMYRYNLLHHIVDFKNLFNEHKEEFCFFVQPSMYEARKSIGFYRTKHKNLWFCKDWKE